MRQINHIVIHCTATPQKATVKSIQNYWRTVMGWKSPGYHRLIDADGNVHILSDYNKPTNGVKGHNHDSVHISYIGGVDQDNRPIDNRTHAQRQAMLDLIIEAMVLFPRAEVCGHRDFPGVKKACPSFNVREWLKTKGIHA